MFNFYAGSLAHVSFPMNIRYANVVTSFHEKVRRQHYVQWWNARVKKKTIGRYMVSNFGTIIVPISMEVYMLKCPGS